MLEENNKYFLTGYKSGALLVRKAYLPLLVYFGKKEHSYFFTMPPTSNKALDNEWYEWFHNDFVEIVSQIVQKRNISLEEGQKVPSRAGGKCGWYLPVGVLFELHKMWAEEKVPMLMELLRPSDLIYGKGWTKQDIENVIEEYLSDNPTKLESLLTERKTQ